MKKRYLIFFLGLFANSLFAQNIIQFKISKPYSVFNFLETAIGRGSYSKTFQQFINLETKGNQEFNQLYTDFAKIQTDYSYRRDQFPGNRRQNRNTYDLICIALVNSDTFDEFKNKIIGLLPNEDLQNLIQVLKKTESIYNQVIWDKYQAKAYGQLAALDKYTSISSEFFNKINRFYNGSWDSDMPFVVSLFPIPGKTGNTTATPHANSLCVGVLTDEKDSFARFGVVMHEMCHVLYDEQSKDFQEQLEMYFAQNQSPYKKFARNFFDEGLATAIGNGWAYKNLSGTADTTEWYNNEYINGFAKELFPMVENYIDSSKVIDESFINEAIDIFGKRFPNAISDYATLINRVTIYNDAENEKERKALMQNISKYFQMSSSNFSSPIADPYSLSWLKDNPETQLVIIDRNNEVNIKELKKIFPEISNIEIKNNAILCFYDRKNRANIILNAQNTIEVDKLLQFISKQKYFDLKKIIQK